MGFMQGLSDYNCCQSFAVYCKLGIEFTSLSRQPKSILSTKKTLANSQVLFVGLIPPPNLPKLLLLHAFVCPLDVGGIAGRAHAARVHPLPEAWLTC